MERMEKMRKGQLQGFSEEQEMMALEVEVPAVVFTLKT
jgi:hypothetical protein